jgi:hypothetical protein
MLAPANPPRNFCRLWFLAVFLHAIFLSAQIPAQQTQAPGATGIAPGPRACGCADGRRFPIGASMFAKNSARVVITGFRPDLPAITPGGKPAPCTDLVVLGQAVQLARAQDGRPFLKRQSLKRGIIHGICDTKIQFGQTKKTYDFFADDGSAITLTEKDVGLTSIPENSIRAGSSAPNEVSQVAADEEVELDENLTGRDLLQLARTKALRGLSPDHPEDVPFDAEDLKEGAYFVCRRRSRAALVGNNGFQRISASHTSVLTGKQEISILAGTLGRIEESAGFRSEPLWVVEILPDSAPLPFLRSLISFPRGLGGPREPALSREVILASSDIVEINHFLDRSGVEWTRLGEMSEASGVPQRGTIPLPMLYARPVLLLEENLATAERSGILAAVQEVTRGLRLVFRDSEASAQRRTLVFDERAPGDAHGDAVPDLLRRQCFLGMDRLGSSQERATEDSTRPALLVTGADVRVFRPKDWLQVPPSYYAIDLELLLRPNFSLKQVPLVCRFPLASIDLALVDMAQGILSTRFEIHRETETWRKD